MGNCIEKLGNAMLFVAKFTEVAICVLNSNQVQPEGIDCCNLSPKPEWGEALNDD